MHFGEENTQQGKEEMFLVFGPFMGNFYCWRKCFQEASYSVELSGFGDKRDSFGDSFVTRIDYGSYFPVGVILIQNVQLAFGHFSGQEFGFLT